MGNSFLLGRLLEEPTVRIMFCDVAEPCTLHLDLLLVWDCQYVNMLLPSDQHTLASLRNLLFGEVELESLFWMMSIPSRASLRCRNSRSNEHRELAVKTNHWAYYLPNAHYLTKQGLWLSSHQIFKSFCLITPLRRYQCSDDSGRGSRRFGSGMDQGHTSSADTGWRHASAQATSAPTRGLEVPVGLPCWEGRVRNAMSMKPWLLLMTPGSLPS